MKVINVIKDTCTYLQLENELEYLNTYDEETKTFNGESVVNNTSLVKNLNLLVKCFNFVLNTVCSEYVKLKDSVWVHTTTGKISYDEISSNEIVSVISCENESGKKIQFADFGGEIVINQTGKIKVNYTYMLNDLEITDEVNVVTIPEKTFAYGVASEYLYITKLFDDASVWDTRFKNSLLNLLSTKKQLYIKPRRWF